MSDKHPDEKVDTISTETSKVVLLLADEMETLSLPDLLDNPTTPTSILDLFKHEPIASQICQEVYSLFSPKPSTNLQSEHLSFASTCRMIHRNMARYTFREVAINRPDGYLQPSDEVVLLPDWHPDSLREIRALLFTAQVNSWDANSMFKSSPLLEHLEYQKALPSITEAKAIAEAGSITTLIVGSATYPIVLRYLNALPSLKSLSVLNSNIPRYEFGHLSGPSMPCLPSVDRVVLGTPMDPGYYTQFRDVWPIDRLFPSMGSFCLYNANENKDPQQIAYSEILPRLLQLRRCFMVLDFGQISQPDTVSVSEKAGSIRQSGIGIWTAQQKASGTGTSTSPAFDELVVVQIYTSAIGSPVGNVGSSSESDMKGVSDVLVIIAKPTESQNVPGGHTEMGITVESDWYQVPIHHLKSRTFGWLRDGQEMDFLKAIRENQLETAAQRCSTGWFDQIHQEHDQGRPEALNEPEYDDDYMDMMGVFDSGDIYDSDDDRWNDGWSGRGRYSTMEEWDMNDDDRHERGY